MYTLLTKWRSSVEAGSNIPRVEHPSRMDETPSSIPERISSAFCGKGSLSCTTHSDRDGQPQVLLVQTGAGTSSGSMTCGMVIAAWKVNQVVHVVNHQAYAIRRP